MEIPGLATIMCSIAILRGLEDNRGNLFLPSLQGSALATPTQAPSIVHTTLAAHRFATSLMTSSMIPVGVRRPLSVVCNEMHFAATSIRPLQKPHRIAAMQKTLSRKTWTLVQHIDGPTY
jgi:hypothetical protein